MNETIKELSNRLLQAPLPDWGVDWASAVDYADICQLTRDDNKGLIEIAKLWLTEGVLKNHLDEHEHAEFLPVFAWRALGQMKSINAVQPLIDMMSPLDSVTDDWFLEDFPVVFGLIGETAIAPLEQYIGDENQSEYARQCAIRSSEKIGQRHPEFRTRIVGILESELKKFHADAHVFNAWLVGSLIDLKAKEAIETIEQAHAKNLVDVALNGDWKEVCEHLGVPPTDTPMPKPPFDGSFNIASPTFAVVAAAEQDGELDPAYIRQSAETLSHLFSNSPEFQSLKSEYHSWPIMFLDLACRQLGVSFLTIDKHEAEEAVLEVIPRKVSCSAEQAGQIVDELHHFFRYIDRIFDSPHAAAIADFLSAETADRLTAELSNPENFGSAKSFSMQATDAGFDIIDQENMAEFALQYNESIVQQEEKPAAKAKIPMSAAEKKALNKERKKLLAKKHKRKKRK